MSEELDWAGLDEAVKKVASRVKGLREENRALRRDVKKLTRQLAAKQDSDDDSSSIELDVEVRERLAALEANLASLLS